MKKFAALALFVGMSALPALAATETFKDASVDRRQLFDQGPPRIPILTPKHAR